MGAISVDLKLSTCAGSKQFIVPFPEHVSDTGFEKITIQAKAAAIILQSFYFTASKNIQSGLSNIFFNDGLCWHCSCRDKSVHWQVAAGCMIFVLVTEVLSLKKLSDNTCFKVQSEFGLQLWEHLCTKSTFLGIQPVKSQPQLQGCCPAANSKPLRHLESFYHLHILGALLS